MRRGRIAPTDGTHELGQQLETQALDGECRDLVGLRQLAPEANDQAAEDNVIEMHRLLQAADTLADRAAARRRDL